MKSIIHAHQPGNETRERKQKKLRDILIKKRKENRAPENA